ncbi:MAG: HAD family hydrolase [Eubacterium sp.]|jgi:Cof subfamily protein (haloacid dehalogenase superfamily)|nr:HAD family hydrolase [Eubacterium sp.]
MAKKIEDVNISDILLVTDVDGTLLNDEHEISNLNYTAIKTFMDAGGMFTIATGRGISMSEPIARALKLNCPAIIFNGAAVHDFESNKQIWHCSLKSETGRYLELIAKKFPGCAIEILRNDNVYVVKTNELEEYHLEFGNVTPVRTDLYSVPEKGRLKALIIDEREMIDRIMDYCLNNCPDDVHWVRSAPIYYEMLPKNVDKGKGMQKLLEVIGDKFTVAVGDFMNDIELLKYADIGIAVGNAEESVKDAADMTVADNNNNAIFDIIEYIMANCRKK